MAAKKKEEEEDSYRVIEVNLISAQDLRAPATTRRNFQTYAVVWMEDPARKLRTRTDSSSAGNPTWNDKFLFRISPEFMDSPTAGINIQIYAVRTLKDSVVGTARCLLSSCLGKFASVYIHRPSGNFHGILNLAAAVRGGEDELAAELEIFRGSGSSTVNFHDLTMAARKSTEVRKKSTGLFGMLRLVKSSPSLTALAVLPPRSSSSTRSTVRSEPEPEPEHETVSLRPVQSDPSISTRLSATEWNGASFSSDSET